MGQLEGQRESSNRESKRQVKTHHIFPSPSAQNGTTIFDDTISDLNKLFLPVPEYSNKSNATQTQEAKDVAKNIDLTNLAEIKDTHLIRILTETGNMI